MITELRPSLIPFCTSLIARYYQLDSADRGRRNGMQSQSLEDSVPYLSGKG